MIRKTDEIMKALECDTHIGCEDCPYFRKNCNGIIDDEVTAKDIIDLINRQKAEIEELKDILYDADGINLVNYWHQQCKIAENGCRNFEEENENLKAEIERFKEECSCLGCENEWLKAHLETVFMKQKEGDEE